LYKIGAQTGNFRQKKKAFRASAGHQPEDSARKLLILFAEIYPLTTLTIVSDPWIYLV